MSIPAPSAALGERGAALAAEADRAERRRFLRALALCAIGAIVIGLSPLFVRGADVGPHASAFWRAVLALPLALAWAAWEARRAPDRGAVDRDAARRGLALAALGGAFFAGDLTFWHLSILSTTLANATFVTNSLPVILVGLGAWGLFREAPPRRYWLATLAALLGAALLLGESARLDPDRIDGDLAAGATAVFFSAYLLTMRAAGRGARAGAAMLVAGAATACGLVLAFLASGEDRLLPQSVDGWAAVIALGLLCQGLGQGAVMTSLRVLPAETAALLLLLEPLTTAALGWLWAGESLSAMEFAGGAAALAAIAIGAGQRRSRPNVGPSDIGRGAPKG